MMSLPGSPYASAPPPGTWPLRSPRSVVSLRRSKPSSDGTVGSSVCWRLLQKEKVSFFSS